MNIYQIKIIKNGKKLSSSIIATLIGTSTGACSCGPIAISLFSTFGAVGSITTSFLTTYEIPIRLFSILILIAVIFISTKSLSHECRV